MIYKYEDFIDTLAELHPEVERKALANIVKKGLQGVNRLMRSGQELVLHNFHNGDEYDDWIKFFINMTPAEQKNHAMRNYYRKLKNKNLNGTTGKSDAE